MAEKYIEFWNHVKEEEIILDYMGEHNFDKKTEVIDVMRDMDPLHKYLVKRLMEKYQKIHELDKDNFYMRQLLNDDIEKGK